MNRTIELDGRRFSWWEEGSGLPVLLLHGFAEDRTIWEGIVPHLGTSCRVLVPDLPGSGGSDLLPGEASIDALADSIKAFADALRIDEAILVGHSMGGYVSLAFAEKYPGRLKGFGFFHSTAYSDSEEKRVTRRKSIEFIRQHGVAPFIRQSTPNLFAAETQANHPELVEEIIRRYSNFAPGSLIYYYEAMIRRPDRVAVLRSFPRPVLFLTGESDTVVPYAQLINQSHEPLIAMIHTLTGSGHMGMLEEPERGSEFLNSFINFVQQL